VTPETTMVGGFSPESAESAIEFRVLREGLPRRRIRLVGTRYTLGSGPDCSVRLEDPQLLPLHATILREGVQVTVKAFGRAITVNGQARTESPLRPGDWFVLGSYRFEYLASASVASPTASSSTSSATSSAVSRGTVAQLPRRVDDPQGSGLAEAEGGEGYSRGRVIPRRRVSFSESMRTIVSQEPASEWTAASEDRSDLRERRAQLRSSLVAIDPEGRWQKRYAQQQRRYRERTERAGEQMQALRHAQESAERRARQAEEGMQSLQAQLDALSERFKRIQQEMEAIEGETRTLRQHAEVSEGQSQELSRATKQLEASLQELRCAQQGREQRSEEALGELRGELLQVTGRFTEFTAQYGQQSQRMERLGNSIAELSASVEQMCAESAEVVSRESLDPLRKEIEQGQQQLAQLVAEFDAQGVHYEQELEELRQRMEWYEQRLEGSEPRSPREDDSAMIEPSWDASSSFDAAEGDRLEGTFSEGVAAAIEGYSEGENLEIDQPWEEIEGVAEEEETELSGLYMQRSVELREPVDELHEPVDELHEPVDELHEPVDELHEPVDELHEPVDELHDRVVEPREAPAPAPQRTALSAAEILARMGLSIGEDESDVAPQRPSPPRVEPQEALPTSPARMDTVGREPGSASGGAEEGEEESIEAYMNRLLQRVQSGPEKTVVLESPPKVSEKAVERKVEVMNLPPLSAADEPPRRTHAKAPEMEADAVFGNEEAEPVSPQAAATVLPKRPVSERIPNLAAMRELANSTARTAIAASAQRRLVNQAIYKFGISCGALVAGVTILVGTQFSMDYWMVIAVCCLLLSGFFFWESMLLRRRLRTSRKEYAASVAAHSQAGSPAAPA